MFEPLDPLHPPPSHRIFLFLKRHFVNFFLYFLGNCIIIEIITIFVPNLKTKIMKQIPGYENYSIDEDGTVIQNNKPNARSKELKISIQTIKGKETGYRYVTLLNSMYEWKRCSVSRLVGKTYIPNPLNLPEINHKNRIRWDDRIDNLEWCTHQENIQHSFDNGRVVAKGEDSKLFGRKASKKTRQKMSDKKSGILHPKFKGYVVINGFRYNSYRQASDKLKIDGRTIKRRCNDIAYSKEYTFVKVDKVKQ